MSETQAVQIKKLDAVTVLSIRFATSLATISQDMPESFRKLCEAVSEGNMEVRGIPFALYHCPEFDPNNIDAETCIPVKGPVTAPEGMVYREIPAEEAVTAIHKGHYRDIEPTYHAIFAWMKANGKNMNGPIRETYLNDPHQTQEAELLTEVAIPV